MSGLGGFFVLGLIVGVMIGLMADSEDDIYLVESMRWQSGRFWKYVLGGLIFSLFLGLIQELVCSQVLGRFFSPLPCSEQGNWMIVVLLYLPYVLIAGIIEGLSVADMSNKVSPNQGITLSLKNALITMLIMVLTFGLIVGLFGWLRGDLSGGLGIGLGLGLLAGLVGLLIRGGSAVIKHYALRLILWLTGATPFRFIPFLDYCAKLIILKKVGGGYIFIHRTLLEYFAGLPHQTPRTSSRGK